MMFTRNALLFICLFVFAACSVQKQIHKQARHAIFSQPELSSAHIGISIFDPQKNSYLFNHQANKYFLPASNTKLFTCYAAMKYLGDSIAGLRYYTQPNENQVWIQPTGDPTLLHPDFKEQPVIDFFRSDTSRTYLVADMPLQTTALGSGWSWNDYQQSYMAERSAFPVYGNLIWISYRNSTMRMQPSIIPLEQGNEGNYSKPFDSTSAFYSFKRNSKTNTLLYADAKTPFRQQQIPIVTSVHFTADVLKSELKGLKIKIADSHLKNLPIPAASAIRTVYVQHTDSLLKPMMHQSDNFFAEQSLLMVSEQLLGVMNDRKVIDTLVKMNFSDIPDKPNWVDGSGLSRYNLFTPMNFVTLLRKMQQEFSWERITTILPTGGTGTLNNFYKDLRYKIFAKTGTLGGQVALSGYLITKKNRTLIFSVLVNNHQTAAVNVRRAVENFILNIYNKY